MHTGGLIDLQVNGYAGVDFNDPAITPDGVDHALEAMMRAGVCHCLPTLVTAPPDELAIRLAALDRAVATSRLGPVMVAGYHLEGPFLSPEPGYVGCHRPDSMSPPDPFLLARLARGLSRPILLLTLAPEREGAIPLIRTARARGIVVAIGHSALTPEALSAAAEAGATLSTHLGNGLPASLPKLDNAFLRQLADDRLHASVIADGIHIPPSTLRIIARAKGEARLILISDATAAAAAAPGEYSCGSLTLRHAPDGSVRLPTGTLAGSSLTLDRAIRNVVGWGVAPATALRFARDNPAALLADALDHHGLRLTPSSVLWSQDLRPVRISAGAMSLAA